MASIKKVKIIVKVEEVEKMAEAMRILSEMLKLYHSVACDLNADNLAFDSWFTRLIKENDDNLKTIIAYWKNCQHLLGEIEVKH